MRLKGNPINDYVGSNTVTQDCPRQLTHDLFYISWIILWVYMLICAHVWRPEISLGCCSIEPLHFSFFETGPFFDMESLK